VCDTYMYSTYFSDKQYEMGSMGVYFHECRCMSPQCKSTYKQCMELACTCTVAVCSNSVYTCALN